MHAHPPRKGRATESLTSVDSLPKTSLVFIPIRDNNPTRRAPIVTYALIALNIAVFLHEVSLGPGETEAFVERFGLVPYWIFNDPTFGSWVTPLTSMFMHGGWMHIIGNLWFLHIFGDNVEDELGRLRYVVFYLLCGLGAAIGQVAIDPSSRVPMVGASGAIFGVLGGYVMLHPRARILTLVPIFIFLQFIEIPAFIYIFIYFGIQVLSGYLSLHSIESAGGGGVAFFAHIGGFVTGFLLVRLMRRRCHSTEGWQKPRTFDPRSSW